MHERNKKFVNGGNTMMKPLVTEKAVMSIESQNMLTFETEKRKQKQK